MKLSKNHLVNKIKRILFNVFLILPAIIFLSTGFKWLVNPQSAASSLMMPLLTGAGLSSQIGDIGGLFLGMGLLIMSAVVFKKSDFLLAVATLLSCIVVYRLMGFAIHGATIIIQIVVFESVLAIWFFTAARIMSTKGVGNA